MTLIVKDKEIVVPGQVLANGMEFLPSTGTYRLKDDILANRLGLIKIEGKVIKSIPLSGVYIPRKNDVIIGRVVDILMSGWRLDMNSPYSSVLGLQDASFDFIPKGTDLTQYFNLDDYVVVRIIQVTSQNLVDVTAKGPGLKKLGGGRIIKVSPHKVPRIIGSNANMLNMIKRATGCKIVVGQNGIIWLTGEPTKENVANQTIKMIEEQSHINGLTDKIKKYLEATLKVEIDKLPELKEEVEEDRPRRTFNRPPPRPRQGYDRNRRPQGPPRRPQGPPRR